MILSEAISILRRDAEVAAAKKKGRHRDSDMQMKAFFETYESDIATLLTKQKFTVRTDESPKLLHNDVGNALRHQAAVQKAMKRDQDDLKNNLDAAPDWNDLEVIQAALDNEDS